MESNYRYKGSVTIACLLFIFFILSSNTFGWVLPLTRQMPAYTLQEVLVQYRPEATYADIGGTYTTYGLQEVRYSPYNGVRRVWVPSNSSVYTVAAQLNQNPLITYAEPNYVRTANFIPNDPLYRYQWHLNNPMMQQTWDLSMGNNIIVAVLDSGVAYRNGGGFAQAPDLSATSFIPGYDFVNDDSFPDDDNRHGTHIAGIIAQSTNNLTGGSGVAPGCTLMPIKVLDDTGAGDVADIVDAIYFAVNNGAQIINMSYGFVTSPSASEEEAINYAVSQGVTIICSAGNEATNEAHYPSSYDATICVTAARYDHSFADSYSNYGVDVDICAPGGDLGEDVNGDGYPDGIYQQTHNGVDFKEFNFYFAEGTSCASAFVSGLAALILARAGRPLSPTEIRQILQSTATDLGDPGWDQFYGWGLVNPLAAVQASVSYSAAGYFLPGPVTQSFSPLTIPYKIADPFRATSPTTPIRTDSTNYQINSGFAPLTQTGLSSVQPLNNQIITNYPVWQALSTFTSGLSALINPYVFPQVSSFQGLIPYTQPSNYGTASGVYQTESAFSPQYPNNIYNPITTQSVSNAFTLPFQAALFFFPLRSLI